MSQKRHAAFLRGMNVGGHRITNVALCAAIQDLGFGSPSAFLASGNVVFDAPKESHAQVVNQLAHGLRESLGYDVPTFVRTAEEVCAIAAKDLFASERDGFGGKLQVTLLTKKPKAAVARRVLNLATDDDLLALQGRELYWLPRGGLLESDLDHKAIEAELGVSTTRTHRTIVRLAAKYFAT